MIPNSFNAAVLTKKRKIEVKKISWNKKLKIGQVFVKILISGFCGKQNEEFNELLGKDIYFPHCLGHEAVGLVISKHKKVKKVKRGDKVLIHWKKSIGLDASKPNYYFNNKKINSGKVTTFSEFSILPENRLTVVNKYKNLEKLCSLGCTFSTGIGSVLKQKINYKNKIALVVGCGPIGLSIIQALRYYGIKKIISFDKNKKALNLAKKNGSNINIQNFKILKSKKLYKMIDICFFCIGNNIVFQKIYNRLKAPSKTIVVGVPNPLKKVKIKLKDIHDCKLITGSNGGDFKPNKDIPKYLKLINKNKLNPNLIFGKRYKLNNIKKLFKDIEKGIPGKFFIYP